MLIDRGTFQVNYRHLGGYARPQKHESVSEHGKLLQQGDMNQYYLVLNGAFALKKEVLMQASPVHGLYKDITNCKTRSLSRSFVKLFE